MADEQAVASAPASPRKKKPDPLAPPAVVGIGASAGGLSALRSFFAHVPPDSDLAYVVVVHLSPDRESHLADLLQPHVKMPVQQVTETVKLEANQVYVIPPNANLNAVDTHLRLSSLEEQRRQRAPIDHFLRTLAKTHDGHGIGVILTGTGSDGSLGIRSIKDKGGLTIAQDPDEAEYDGMPRSAISTGMIDLVLKLEEIPDAVIRFAKTEPKVVVPDDEQDLEGEQRRLLQKVLAQVRARTTRDFSRYKRSTIMRRIQRRMQLRQIIELGDYVELLRKDADEVRALADDFLITVTNFFRDPDTWEQVEREIVPDLFAGKTAGDSVRVWSVGCATGEEAYSIAMLLIEEAGRREFAPQIQVFASDLHDRSLGRAREGFYPGDIETDVSPERLRRFFVKEDGGYRIRKEVRELVVFAPHNLLADPPFSRVDLVMCRNVLIYLQRDIQKDVLEIFHYSLLPDGHLVLGGSETADQPELFITDSKKFCIYRKRNVRSPEPRLSIFPTVRLRVDGDATRLERAEPFSYGAIHQRMVERYAPPSLLISPDYKIVHLSEHAGSYLSHPGGEPTSNVFKLVRDELRVELRAAIHMVKESREPFVSRPIPVDFSGERRAVTLNVRPAFDPDHDGFFLVIFDERPNGQVVHAQMASSAGEGRIEEAEAELDLTKQRLRGIIEEYETSQEEMKASHEELQSANEELRSTLEELETSKEELQSMNEELQTVNQENRHKVEELAQLSGDLQNLLTATQIATLFLDRDLRILRFTPQIGELFNVRPVDRGRPLSDLTHRLGYAQLQDDAESVLRNLTPIEREVRDESERYYLARVLPYRSGSDRIEGVVITFIDITARKTSEEELRETRDLLTMATAASQLGWGIWDFANGGSQWDERGRQILGLTPEESTRVDAWRERVHPEDRARVDAHIAECIENRRPFDIEYRVITSGDEVRCVHGTGAFEFGPGGEPLRGTGLVRDVTARKQAENALREAKKDAEQASQAKSQFLAILSHELKTPLSGILTYCDLLESGLLADAPEKRQEALARIRTSSWHLASLIDEILTFSRVEAGKEEIHPSEVDLSEMVREGARIVQVQAESRGLGLNIVNADEPVIAWTDEGKVRKVLINLIGNAIKYTEKGEIIVELDRSDPLWHRILVRDTGVGISDTNFERIFEPFTQLEPSLTRREPGTGLGLAICRRLARLIGGDVVVESHIGDGSTFTLLIPVRQKEYA